MGFSIEFDLVYGHGPQLQDVPPASCYRETAAAQGQPETGYARAWATPLVIRTDLGHQLPAALRYPTTAPTEAPIWAAIGDVSENGK